MNREWIDRLDILVPIEGSAVRLEALTTSHHADLCVAGLDDELWRWTVSTVRTPDDMAAYIDDALTLRAAYAAFPFVMIAHESGRDSVYFSTIDGEWPTVKRGLEGKLMSAADAARSPRHVAR